MKPLLAKELPNFVSRFGNFIDAEIRSIKTITPTSIRVVIACQDTARNFDWISISLEFYNIIDAKLIDNEKLSFMDMGDGLSLIYEKNYVACGIGKYHNLSGIKNASCYIISSEIKFEEGLF